MADPRDITDFSEIGKRRVTYKIDNSTIVYLSTATNGSASVGLAVTFSAARTVALAADGDTVVGKLEQVDDDGFATVAVEGYMEFKGGASALLTQGLKIVGALDGSANKGFVRGIAIATLSDVAKGRGEIIDPTDTAAVWVLLGA